MIKIESVATNVVILAEQFNPSIVNQLWLVKINVAKESDFKDGCTFAPVLTDVHTKEFDLLIVPDRLVFKPQMGIEANQKIITSKIGKIVSELPHTPFKAVGLNFTWFLTNGDVYEFSKALFHKDSVPIYEEFQNKDARFGGYLSKDILGFRLKLSIKPVIKNKNTDDSIEGLEFSFNFHADLSSDSEKGREVLDILKKWSKAKSIAQKTIDTVIKWGEK